MDTSYVPNNPQFGLQLECNWSSSSNCVIPTNAVGTQQIPSSCATDDLSSCWSEDMGSFSLPLDLEPLPSLFPFSPCSNTNTYKTEPLQNHQQAQYMFRDNKQPSADMADVLLSLKHAVVHPGQTSVDPQQHSLYHPQVILSPGGYGGSLCEQNFGQQPSIFPSMSVNVSMNMTMHGYHPPTSYPTTELSCPQVQWSTTPQSTSPTSYQSQGLLSPGYGGATYSFTADFRPPQDTPITYKTVPMSFSSPRRRHNINLIDEDSQKPNVCRICVGRVFTERAIERFEFEIYT